MSEFARLSEISVFPQYLPRLLSSYFVNILKIRTSAVDFSSSQNFPVLPK
jgi:hypothetical protein